MIEEINRKFVETPKMNFEQFKKNFSHHTQIIFICQIALLRVLEITTDQPKTTKFENQAAGHAGDILKDGETIFKRYCEREFLFYELIKKLPKIRGFFANYYGRKSIGKEGIVEHYIVLEDLTHGMKQPCIMDLKMAKNTWEPTAPAKKRIEQATLDKISTSESLGFRICGMRIWQIQSKEYIVRDKPWGMGIKVNQMEAALRSFFHNGQTFRTDLIEEVLPQLYDIFEWFKAQRIFRFYGSSILFLYDGAETEKPFIRAKMVDFAHTVRIKDGGKDDSYKFGLWTLIDILEGLLGRKSRMRSVLSI
uniref:Kinase n=1 Tax=Arcella intermedia TaxID=1963864 RepID=A0A6B2LA02_9EUKA